MSPTLRSFLAVVLLPYSREEVNGVMQFAKEKRLDLEKPLPIQIKNGKIFVSNSELRVDRVRKTILYRGYTVKTKDRAIDRVLREFDDRLHDKEAGGPWISFFPRAQAAVSSQEEEDSEQLASEVSSILFGDALLKAPAKSSNSAASLQVAAGAILGLAGSLALGAAVYIASISPANSSEMLHVQTATCDDQGLKVEMDHGKTFSIGHDLGSQANLVFKVNGETKSASDMGISDEALGSLHHKMDVCFWGLPPDKMKTALQNAVNRQYSMEAQSSGTGIPTPSSSTSGTP